MRTIRQFARLCFGIVATGSVALVAQTVLTTLPSASAPPPANTVIVYRNRVEPSKIIVSSGVFLLLIENATGNSTETFRLDVDLTPSNLTSAAPTTPPIALFAPPVFRRFDYKALSLPPGNYRVRLGSRNDLSFEIVVNQK